MLPRHLLPLAVAAPMIVAAAPAGATVSAPPLAGAHFAYVSREVGDSRCSWGNGVQFAPVANATSYSVEYFDGYWQADAGGTKTVAEFLQDPASTPSALYFGITGGTGPDPCTGDDSDGGRFTKPPTVIPVYPDGKTPPLSHHASKARPKGAGSVAIEAAAGTFKVGSQAYVDVLVKAGSKPIANLVTKGMKVGSKTISPNGYGTVTLAKHHSTVWSFLIDGTKAGKVPLKLTFKALSGMGKKARKVTLTGTSSITFG